MDVRVFLVEDQKGARTLLEDALSALGGFRVVGSAGSEAEAALWLAENTGGWDLAVVDLLLEQGSGISVLAQCTAQPIKGQIVVFSGYASPAVAQRCLSLGADAVFDKADVRALLDFCRDLGNRENSV